jgi:hypothetical protein
MTSREKQIHAHVGDAYDFMAAQQGFTPMYGVVESPAMAALVDAPDDTEIHGFDWNHPVSPNEVLVSNYHELEMSIRALERVAQGPVRRGVIQQVALHVGLHGIAAEQVGFQRVGFGLGILAVGPQMYNWYAFCTREEPVRPPTKLEMAAIAVAPGMPSEADTDFVEALGYFSPIDVINRIQDHNLAGNGRPIPMPLCSETLVA